MNNLRGRLLCYPRSVGTGSPNCNRLFMPPRTKKGEICPISYRGVTSPPIVNRYRIVCVRDRGTTTTMCVCVCSRSRWQREGTPCNTIAIRCEESKQIECVCLQTLPSIPYHPHHEPGTAISTTLLHATAIIAPPFSRLAFADERKE